MDERYEHLCEIGQVLMDSDRKDLMKVYVDLMLEHYPVELLEVFGDSDSDSDYEPEVSASEVSASEVSASAVSASSVEQIMAQEEITLELQGGEEPEYETEEESDSGSEDERAMAEIITVQKEGGFYSLA